MFTFFKKFSPCLSFKKRSVHIEPKLMQPNKDGLYLKPVIKPNIKSSASIQTEYIDGNKTLEETSTSRTCMSYSTTERKVKFFNHRQQPDLTPEEVSEYTKIINLLIGENNNESKIDICDPHMYQLVIELLVESGVNIKKDATALAHQNMHDKAVLELLKTIRMKPTSYNQNKDSLELRIG